MAHESNIKGVESLEVTDMAMKSKVEDALVIPRFYLRYEVICESYSDDRKPVDDYGTDAGAETTEDLRIDRP